MSELVAKILPIAIQGREKAHVRRCESVWVGCSVWYVCMCGKMCAPGYRVSEGRWRQITSKEK